MSEERFVISQQDGYEWGGSVVAIATSRVVAAMAEQQGWQVWRDLPVFETSQDFIAWSETTKWDVSA